MTSRSTLLARAGAGLLAAALLPAALEAQSVQLYDLGGSLWPTSSTTDGSLIVGENNSSGQYFEWTASGGATDIGGAIAGNGIGGTPRISEDGSFVGGTALNAGTGLYEISRYDRGTGLWTNLGGIGGSSGNSTSSGWAISGDGQHVVGLGWVNAGTAHAIQWSQGVGTFDLGSTVAGESSRANGVDLDGNVVVGWQDGSGRNGAVWIDGVQSLITTPGGGLVGEAGAVSDDGQWVVGIGIASTNNQAWRWSQATGAEALGSLNLPGFPPPRGYATDISGDGSVIVGFDRGFGPAVTGEGWIWTEATGLVSLDDYLAGLGLVVSNNLRLSLPLGISGDGKTIFGLGRSDTAFLTSWVVTIEGCDAPTNYCQAVANSTGSAGSIGATGSTSVAANDLVLTASGLPSGQNGIFFYGAGQQLLPFGPGFVCVSSPFFRLPVVGSDAGGNVAFPLDLGSLPTGGQIDAGSTWNFQFWYRDPAAGGVAFNTTDGLTTTWCP